jgi:hydrogenase maturation protease
MMRDRVGQQFQQHQPHVLIIGVGNEYRRDDAVGLAVARVLKDKELPNTTILEATGEGTVLMEALTAAEKVILIDAVVSGAGPGSLRRFDLQLDPLPTDLFIHSTHAFSVVQAIELARILNRLPPYLVLYGIEGKNFAAGVGLSEQVENAVPEVVERVVREVRSSNARQTDFQRAQHLE